MPRIVGSKLNKETGQYEMPAPGGSVGGGLPPVNPQIKNLLGADGNEEDFVKSLGDGAPKQEEEGKQKRSYARKPKTQPEAPADPNMSDPRYARIAGKYTGLGGETVISTVFKVTGNPLSSDEKQELDDYFYFVGKKANFDPGQSWIAIVIIFLVILCNLIVARTDLGKWIKELFTKAPEPQPLPVADGEGMIA